MQKGTRTHHRGGQKTSSEVPLRRSKHHTERVNESLEQEGKDDDEVVKYMSKLPGYLQGGGGGEEECNVLNVGVLDWSRLEKWKKHGRVQRSGGCTRDTRVSSTSTTTALGTFPNNGFSSSHQYHRHRCKIDDQVHASSLLGKVASRGLQHSSAHRVPCTLEPEFASTDAFNKHETATCSYNKSSGKGRRSSTSGFLPEMGNSNGSLGVRGEKESEKRAGSQEAIVSWKECADKLDGEEKAVGDSKQENHQVSNIVHLRSRKHSRSNLSGDPQRPSSLDDNAKVTREVSSHFSEGITSSLGLRSQVPRSCPLSLDFERDSEDMRLPIGVDLSCKQERFGGTRSHSKTGSSRVFDQEKKRDPSSPSKRFSFSFGRLSRSLTYKEDSSPGGQPFDDTIKSSDSKRCDGPSHQSSNPEEKKHCGSSRVSPLRRLLDHPLLKSKGSENVLPSSKEERSTSSSSPKPNRALFQLTTRNGIPLFQFVVDDDDLNNNSRSILGATMKNSATSFKDDSVQYCTFYSVNEVKKKKRGSWLIHGHSKEKQQHRFVYNVIGQMRLCNSDITEKESEKVSCIIRESVLVDETEQVKGSKEVAAVVIKKKKAAEENLNPFEETTVIIPGGVHSFPEKGEPTPLVSRWRSGGLCDCGGWDVGCKLHVLCSKTLLHELDQSFKLFAQEESDQDTGPVFAMTELKTGMYKVEFGSFLSHLQAFFVCVTVITCASEEETVVSKTTGRSSSPFAPPLSPVGRV